MRFFRAPRVGVADLVTVAVVAFAWWLVWPGSLGWVAGRTVGWATSGEPVPSFGPWAQGFGNGAALPGAGAPAWAGVVVTDAKVVRVVDGVTLVVAPPMAGEQTVRLLGVAAPPAGACWARQAAAALGRLAPVGTRVTLATERGQGDRDRAGRLPAYVFSAGVAGADSVNRDLVHEGAAVVHNGRRPTRFTASFRAEQRAARSAGRGMWGAC